MGRVTHFEIPANDPESLTTFYEDVFGWNAETWEGPVEYWLLTTGSADEPGIDGAVMGREEAAPTGEEAVTGYVCTVDVDSIDVTLERVEEHGGTVLNEPQEVPGVGVHAYCADPDGNQFGVMETDEAGP